MNLRPYQADAVKAVEDAWEESRRVLMVLPTGGGKTVVFSHLAARRRPGRTLILAHREELIDQAIQKLHRATGIIAHKEKAEHRASRNAQVVVGSIQTLARRTDRWPRDFFDTIICDEAHHSISPTWQTVLNHFDDAHVLGVTATPDRGDKKNLGSYYDTVAYEIGLFDLIEQGYLCPIRCKSLPLEIDLGGVKQSAGDYDAKGLSSALDPFLGAIAKAIKEHAGYRKILVFLPLIATSEKFATVLNAHGLKAGHVSGESPDRKEILAAFERDQFQVLCNAMLLTEGYDCPSVDCVVNLRPTRSRPLYSQIVGRGTRISDFKDDLLLLDFLWNHERHQLVRPAHLVAGTDEESAIISRQIERSAREGKPGRQGELDLKELASTANLEREEKLAEELKRNAKRKAQEKDLVQFCLDLHRADLADYEPSTAGDAGPVTPKQAEYLKRAGIDPEGVNGKGHASKLIDLFISRKKAGLASPKQVRFCKRLGHAKAETLTIEEATSFISRRIGGTARKRTSTPRPIRQRKAVTI